MEISWRQPTNAYTVTGYDIYSGLSRYSVSRTMRVVASYRSLIISNLQPFTTYYFYVKAVSVAGVTGKSSTISKTTLGGIQSVSLPSLCHSPLSLYQSPLSL